jgi:GNAT superfamily N-acetyltransferase
MTETRLATTADVDACGELFARAFADDPGTFLFEPDPTSRSAFLSLFFRCFVAASIQDGAPPIVPAGAVMGVACWFGPGVSSATRDSMLANGYGEALEVLDGAAIARLNAMVEELEARHEELMAGRAHLRLDYLAVDPTMQGRGIGSLLVEVGHRRADELGLPCYLETFTPANVRFYAKRGYSIKAEFPVGDGVPVFAMERPRR